MKTKELTIILPFLNEGAEVDKTLSSIIEHTKEAVEIILINDCSNDGYDYMAVSKKYGTKYIVNKERCGVARCREIGIASSETTYFLLLDAHMRIYDNSWYSILLKALKKENTTLFCLQSKVLLNICGIIKESESALAYGAFVEMMPNIEQFLSVSWNTQNMFDRDVKDSRQIIEIPCVLGAGYACNKKYWNSIHGLKGLRNYGLDEQFISLKVWLSGGKCKLLNNVVFGHVYRNIAPYNISGVDILYNKLFLSKVLLPANYSVQYEDYLRKNHYEEYKECCCLLDINKELILQERKYFNKICVRTLDDFLNINNKVYTQIMVRNNFEQILAFTLSNIPVEIGLFNGKAGIALIYILLARREQNGMYELMADLYLQQIWNTCSYDTPISFSRGLTGIGWLCEYLYQNQIAVGNPDEVLKDIDNIINVINPLKMRDLSFDNGIIGIMAYVYSRVVGCKMRGTPVPFDGKLLNNIIEVATNNFDKNMLSKNGIAYIYNLDAPQKQLSKRNLIDFIKVSSYNNSHICNCIENLLKEDLLLQ